MVAEPIAHEDPRDPEAILRGLPDQEREFFLHQYRTAVDAAHEVVGYRKLQQFLHAWSLRVIAVNRPGYYEALEEVRDGTAETTPIEQIIAERYGLPLEEAGAFWAEKVAAAQRSR
jgi:Family of unknown function (DUF6247)